MAYRPCAITRVRIALRLLGAVGGDLRNGAAILRVMVFMAFLIAFLTDVPVVPFIFFTRRNDCFLFWIMLKLLVLSKWFDTKNFLAFNSPPRFAALNLSTRLSSCIGK